MTIGYTTIYKQIFFGLIFAFIFSGCDKHALDNVQPSDAINPTTPSKKWIVSTVAGSATAGFKDGDTTQAQFSNAQGIITDNHGNLFVGDQGNASIRQITYSGHVSTFIGKNIGNPEPAFGNIYSLVRDSKGNLYTIEYSLIRKIVSPSVNAVFAGSLSVNYLDGVGTQAAFNVIGNMAIDNQDNIILPDYDNHDKFVLRKVTPNGTVSTFTLNDNTGFSSDGLPNYHYLYAVAVDTSGNIFVTGNGNCLIKKIDKAGNVRVFAGTGGIGFKDGKGTEAQFNTISSMTCDALGNLWVSDSDNHAIRKITPDGVVTTIAGTGQMGYKDGDSTKAQFKFPYGIAVDNTGTLFVMDTGNNRVRKLEYK
jgi:ribosomal protein S11